ncbi:hypothetical protein K474DRAFT_688204 [Panus rudis PR-1116 ss-1]|nr:hypothetical protein K474DRAFT_688204 [Panus rudis PR-1116 ss-1]
MVLHERGSSPPRMSPGGHVDWNYPPAFPGRTVKGRSDRSDPFEVGDIFATSHERQAHHEEQEILEISDDEEEDELDEGPLPLGTSDLDIAPNVDNTLSDDELDANHDTEDVGSEARERTPQHDRTQVEEASSREESIPVLQDPRDLTVVEDPQTYAGLESMYMQTDEYADEADIEETAQDAKSSFEPVDVNADFGYLPSPRVDHDLPDQSQILEVIANAASQEGPVQSVATSGNDVPGDELKDVSMPADPAKIDDVDTTEQPHNAVEESTDKAHVEVSMDRTRAVRIPLLIMI